MTGMPTLPPLNLASSSSAESGLSKSGMSFNFAPQANVSTTEKAVYVGGFVLLATLFYFKAGK